MDNNSSIKDIMNYIKEFCDARDWEQFHNPKDLAIGISTEAGELLDHFRFKNESDVKELMSDPGKTGPIREELADVFYFVLRFAQLNNIDLGQAVEEKMRQNEAKYPVEKAKGRNLKYDEYEAVTEPAADEDDEELDFAATGPEAEYHLAERYFFGRGVPKDPDRAMQLYQSSAKQGYMAAQFKMGYLNDVSYTDNYDMEEAVKWYRMAAEQGHLEAQKNLGEIYMDGLEIGKDDMEAVRWYTLAASQGDADSQYMLATCYLYGDGVSRDFKTALYWYKKAAEGGNERAGELYEVGSKRGEQALIKREEELLYESLSMN